MARRAVVLDKRAVGAQAEKQVVSAFVGQRLHHIQRRVMAAHMGGMDF